MTYLPTTAAAPAPARPATHCGFGPAAPAPLADAATGAEAFGARAGLRDVLTISGPAPFCRPPADDLTPPLDLVAAASGMIAAEPAAAEKALAWLVGFLKQAGARVANNPFLA